MLYDIASILRTIAFTTKPLPAPLQASIIDVPLYAQLMSAEAEHFHPMGFLMYFDVSAGHSCSLGQDLHSA
jgi:hypothetical protein